MQSSGSRAAPCVHTDARSRNCCACRNGSGFLAAHGYELQPYPRRSFGSGIHPCPKRPSARGVWRLRGTDSRCPECACLPKFLGNDDTAAAACQYTAQGNEKWQARHPGECSPSFLGQSNNCTMIWLPGLRSGYQGDLVTVPAEEAAFRQRVSS